MIQLTRDFISQENRDFRFRLGRTMASSLSGFIVGTIFASSVWILAIYIFRISTFTGCR